MSKPEEIRLHFNKTVADALQDCHLKIASLRANLQEFTNYDGEFTEEWVDGLDTELAAAELISTDETLTDEQTGLGRVVDGKVKSGENHFQDVKYHVDKCFPGQLDVHNEFGFDDYGKVRGKVPEFILFLRNIGVKINTKKYRDVLIARKMPASLLTVADQLATELEEANTAYQGSKKVRISATQDRRIAYNRIWDKVALVCAAGKNIYRENYAKYRLFVLYEGAQTLPPVGEEYESLAPQETTTAMNEFNTTDVLLFKNAGVTVLRFFRHTVEEEPNGTVGFTLEPNSETIKPVADLPGEGDFINVTNLSTTESGLFLVQLAE
jgi:hypothetical protein